MLNLTRFYSKESVSKWVCVSRVKRRQKNIDPVYYILVDGSVHIHLIYESSFSSCSNTIKCKNRCKKHICIRLQVLLNICRSIKPRNSKCTLEIQMTKFIVWLCVSHLNIYEHLQHYDNITAPTYIIPYVTSYFHK